MHAAAAGRPNDGQAVEGRKGAGSCRFIHVPPKFAGILHRCRLHRCHLHPSQTLSSLTIRRTSLYFFEWTP